MQVRIAVLLSDEQEKKHLSGVLRRAGLRGDSRVGVVESGVDDADVVLVKASDPLAQAWLGKPQNKPGNPIVVTYGATSPGQQWMLPWPARTHDVLVLAEQFGKHLAAVQQPATGAGVKCADSRMVSGRAR